MKRSTVLVPVVGFLEVTVDHDSSLSTKDIINKALFMACFDVSGTENVEPGDFEVLKAVGTGNTCHAPICNAEVLSTEDLEAEGE